MNALTIRPIREDDAAAVQALVSDPAVLELTRIPSPYPADGAETFIRRTRSQSEEGTDFAFALLAGETLVGLCGLHDVGGRPRSGELGYWIGKPYWGRGYATAGAGQVVRRAFEELGLVRLTAHCLERNPASARVLEKLGFRPVARDANTDPRWLPTDVVVSWELTREAWARH